MIRKLSEYCKTIPVFFITLGIIFIYLMLLPSYIIFASDSDSYIQTAINLKNTLIRPVGYPLLLRLSIFLCHYKYVIIIQALMCATIFQVIYSITKSKAIIIILLLSGTYIVYTPFILSDLSFAFFVILGYYFLVRKEFWWHILMIGLASLFKPTLAWFFIIEPILIWLVFRNWKLAIWSFVLCFLATSTMPLKNFIEHGIWTHSQILNIGINEYYFAQADNKILYMIYSLFANQTSTHWNYLFTIFGYQKGTTPNIYLDWFNWIFSVFYVIVWVRFVISALYERQLSKLIFICYFMAPTILCHAGGGRWRLPFEFLLF